MPTLVVYGGTIVFATAASVYYLLRLASAKRDVGVQGELAVHNPVIFDGISPFHPYGSVHLPKLFFSFLLS